MKPTIIACPTEEAWHAQRAKAIGASEVAALFDLHPYMTRRQLWLRKKGLEPDQETTDAMRAGLLSEDMHARWIAQDHPGTEVWRPSEFFVPDELARVAATQVITRHPEAPLQATPDRVILPSPQEAGLLQLKNVSEWAADEWEEGTPLHVQIQVQAELLCSGFSWAIASALIGGNRRKEHKIEAHPEFHQELVRRASAFWLTLAGDEPPEATAGDLELVRRQFPASAPGLSINYPHPEDLFRLAEVKAKIAQLEEDEKALLAKIQSLAGPAETILGDGQKLATWKSSTRNEAAREARQVPVRTFRLDPKILQAAKAALPRHEHQPILPA